MKKLTHLLKKYWFLALLASGFMVAEVYVDLYQPRMMQLIVDEGILGMSSNGVSNLNLVISTGIRMLLIVLLGGLCGIGSALFTNVTGQSYGNDIRKACFEKVMRFSFEQTDDFSTGSLITRITNDVTQLQQLVMQLIRGLVRCLMFFVGGTAALLSLDLSFGVIAACAFPLILIDIWTSSTASSRRMWRASASSRLSCRKSAKRSVLTRQTAIWWTRSSTCR